VDLPKNLTLKSAKEEKPLNVPNECWNILIVDDEEHIHVLTRLVFRNIKFEGKHINLISAYSAIDARRIISTYSDFAVAFIDVVMESDFAGLDLVHWIRNDNKDHKIRIILRTGQAGYAPEEEIIENYDINDYKNKTELTSCKLKTSLFSSLRSYRDIMIIQNSLAGLGRLVRASAQIHNTNNIIEFGTSILGQLFELLDIKCTSLYVANITEDVYHNTERTILAATGEYVGIGSDYDSIMITEELKFAIEEAFRTKSSKTTADLFIGFYQTTENTSSVLLMHFTNVLDEFKIELLEVYATNIALIFENVIFKRDIDCSQAELIYLLGDAIEIRSKETGSHVKRVSLICYDLAMLYSGDERFSTILSRAAPLHDIGKIAIPESILHKPGNFTPEEWEIMKTHAAIGGDLLASSNKAIAIAGERLARYHHENWDGSGYPEGLKGEDIPIEARIMAVADVFDALGSARSYKKAWPEDEILEYFHQQSGVKFQPELAQLLIDNFQKFLMIRNQVPDNS